MNGARHYFSDQNLNPNSQIEGTNTHYEHLFKTFVQTYTPENTRIYQKRLEMQVRNRRHVLPVEMRDLRGFEEQLYDRLAVAPLDMLTVMEGAVKSYLRERSEEFPSSKGEDWQVAIRSDDHPVRIRDLKSTMISKIFVVAGIIISTTKPFIKASRLKVQCRSCSNVKFIELQPGQWPYVPTFC